MSNGNDWAGEPPDLDQIVGDGQFHDACRHEFRMACVRCDAEILTGLVEPDAEAALDLAALVECYRRGDASGLAHLVVRAGPYPLGVALEAVKLVAEMLDRDGLPPGGLMAGKHRRRSPVVMPRGDIKRCGCGTLLSGGPCGLGVMRNQTFQGAAFPGEVTCERCGLGFTGPGARSLDGRRVMCAGCAR